MVIKKTYIPDVKKIEKKVYLIDAAGKILGKVATKAATILRGKNKAIFTPHLDTGDSVIIINAEKIRVTGKKMTDKVYLRYSGYPSGQRSLTLAQMLKKSPDKVVQLAVNRMIPSGRLGNTVRKHLKVYAGDQHPHQAQKPIPVEV